MKIYPPATTNDKLDVAESPCYPSVNPKRIARYKDETYASGNVQEQRRLMAAKHAERKIDVLGTATPEKP